MVCPDAAQMFPYFSLIRDRLYRVSRDTQMGVETTQLLVPKSRREMVFQAAHFNTMAGHLGYDKTLSRIMARFYWPGIRGEVRRWCASCRECQLVNQLAIPRTPLRLLPLMEVPFERIGMDLIRPIPPECTWVSLCVSPGGLCNVISRGSATAPPHLCHKHLGNSTDYWELNLFGPACTTHRLMGWSSG